jgi:hypothetical protein
MFFAPRNAKALKCIFAASEGITSAVGLGLMGRTAGLGIRRLRLRH